MSYANSRVSPSSPGSPTPSTRRGPGVLLSETTPGLDTIYDGAHQMQSTEYLFGPKGGRWSTSQAYGASFRSATPRPWQRLPTRQEKQAPRIGPGDYEPFNDTHTLSASISWNSRGRCARSPSYDRHLPVLPAARLVQMPLSL